VAAPRFLEERLIVIETDAAHFQQLCGEPGQLFAEDEIADDMNTLITYLFL
jgi:hypothetical protein